MTAEAVEQPHVMHPDSRACERCYRELPDQFEAFPTICPHRVWETEMPQDRRDAVTEKYECIRTGCERGRDTGHALYRTSPKGQVFEGACEAHFDGPADPLVQAIEERNLGIRDVGVSR